MKKETNTKRLNRLIIDVKKIKEKEKIFTQRANLLSLENSKLIEKLDKAKNLGFIE
ncbi:MAG: hypothetical protein AABY22_09355 [Nanoarchaeota archaeon]